MAEPRIVLVGAGSTSFGPAMFTDLFHSKGLGGSTIVLHDINKEHLEIIYDVVLKENEIKNDKFNIERTTNRIEAFKGADFIISSIEVGDRYKLWWQDYKIPRKHGSTQILGECGGPGGSFHAFRIIPSIIEIVKDAEKICPEAFFINFSNPMSRVCLAIKRATTNLKFCGLCHQIGFMDKYIPIMFDERLHDSQKAKLTFNERWKIFRQKQNELRMSVGGLNHFGFLLGLKNLKTGEDLMPEFHKKAWDHFKEHENRFEFSSLTFEVYKRFGVFPYAGDNHMGEYLQFGEEFTETQDMIDWINDADLGGRGIYDRVIRSHKRLKKGKYLRKGMLPTQPTEERAIPIIEAIIENRNSYETAVNIPNEVIIENLPQDLVVEVSVTVDKDGVHGVKIGKIPKGIAALLRIEASIQDLCVEAILKKSKELAITCLAVDPNVGSFESADAMFNEMAELQKDFLGYLK
jgi:alpha-galactosidase